jgi:hypothetical protein
MSPNGQEGYFLPEEGVREIKYKVRVENNYFLEKLPKES